MRGDSFTILRETDLLIFWSVRDNIVEKAQFSSKVGQLTSCKTFWACLIGLKDRNRGDSCCIMLLLVLLLFPGTDRWKLVGRGGCEEKLVVFWDPKNASDWPAITFWTWLISSRFLAVCTQNQTTSCETPDIYTDKYTCI